MLSRIVVSVWANWKWRSSLTVGATLFAISFVVNIVVCWLGSIYTHYDFLRAEEIVVESTRRIEGGSEPGDTIIRTQRWGAGLMDVVRAVPESASDNQWATVASWSTRPYATDFQQIRAQVLETDLGLRNASTFATPVSGEPRSVVMQVFGWPLRSMWLGIGVGEFPLATSPEQRGIPLAMRSNAGGHGSYLSVKGLPIGLLARGLTVNVTCYVVFGWCCMRLVTQARCAFRRYRHRCLQCGYSTSGNVSGRCPECGEPLSKRIGNVCSLENL